MASNKRTWLWVIAGVFGTLFLLFVLFIGSAVYMFRTHVHNQNDVETATAEREFDTQLSRFKGQQPLFEFVGRETGDDEPIVHRPPPDAPRVKINALRVLIYDRAQGHLIRADVPGWLLRAMPYSRGGVFGPNDDFVRNRITIDDLERHGLGLVCDGHNRNTRILIWAE
jgi:hypothetical protein